MEQIIRTVLEVVSRSGLVQVEVSARHVHLSQAGLEQLFGEGASLTPVRELSQPGQYLSKERVTVIGPKGQKEKVAVLGPVRSVSQVELSRTDCAGLGLHAPLRESGDVAGSASVTLSGPRGSVTIPCGCIVAKNHLHMRPETAVKLGISDKQLVGVRLLTERPILFPNVLVRISANFQDRMHVDFDEANAGGVEGFTLGQIVLK